MKYVRQFAIIAAFSFAGELLHVLIPLPIPASIYGIILLFLCLEFRVVRVSDIRETSSFLIGIMPMLFIPAAAGLIDVWGILQNRLVVYIVITLLTTVAVMAVAGRVTQALLRKKETPGQNDAAEKTPGREASAKEMSGQNDFAERTPGQKIPAHPAANEQEEPV